MRRIFQALLTLTLALPTFALACSKPAPPDPTPVAEDDDKDAKKPTKKKKKSADDEDPTKTGEGTGEDAGGAKTATTIGTGTLKPGVLPSATASGSTSEADKAKLMACCTALRNMTTAANAAKTASSTVIPGLPATVAVPKVDAAELDKATKTCDAQVAAWNGDLNASLSKVKNASTVTLPNACAI